jgi:hypothetical protein
VSALETLRHIAGVAALAALCMCGDIDRFEVDVSATAIIAPGTLLDELLAAASFPGFDEISFEQDFENQGVTDDQIDSVRLRRFVVRTAEGSGAMLDFVESAAFYAEAEGLPRVLVASSVDFEGKSSVELEIEQDVELAPYAVAPFMTLSAEIEGRRPAEETVITAEVVLAVDATIPGCE